MADIPQNERERLLVRDAEKRAREDAQVEARVEAQAAQIAANSQRIGEITGTLQSVNQQISSLAADFRQSAAIAATRAEDAEKRAAKQVTSRELYVSAIGVTVAIISALAAGGVFH